MIPLYHMFSTNYDMNRRGLLSPLGGDAPIVVFHIVRLSGMV